MHEVYENLAELLEAYEVKESSMLAKYLAYASGNPITVDLDV